MLLHLFVELGHGRFRGCFSRARAVLTLIRRRPSGARHVCMELGGRVTGFHAGGECAACVQVLALSAAFGCTYALPFRLEEVG
jgi:hypothetical protein